MTPLAPASVVICSRDRPAMLLDAVESILGGVVLPAEIVIADQSVSAHPALSTMGTRSGCAVRYCRIPPTGASAARNAGMRVASHPLLALVDDDVFVDPAWLLRLLEPLDGLGPLGVTTGRVVSTPSEVPGGFAPALVTRNEPATYQGRTQRDVLEAGNMALRRELLLAVGGFDERLGPGTRFPAGEDNDLGFRLLAEGCTIAYVPSAVIQHRAWRGVDDYVPLRWRYGVGQGAYYAKHLAGGQRHMRGRLLRLVQRHLGMAIRRRREGRAVAGHLAYIAGVSAGVVRWKLSAPQSRSESGQAS